MGFATKKHLLHGSTRKEMLLIIWACYLVVGIQGWLPTQPSSPSIRTMFASSTSTSTSTSSRSITAKTSQQSKPPITSQKTNTGFLDGPCGGTVHRLRAFGLHNPMFLPERPIDVWLPPDYKHNNGQQQQHPVLYCHDGQNAMTDRSSWTGASWRLVGAITRLAAEGRISTAATPIVVMIPSADGDWLPGIRRRHLEYAGDGPFANAHAEWVAKTIVPMIDRKFRTDPNERYAIGSSLGGQASLQLVLRYPDMFQGAACMSPYFQPSSLASVKQINANTSTSTRSRKHRLQSKRFYIDIGGDMGDAKVPLFDVRDHLTPEHWWNPGYWWLDSQLQPGVQSMCEALRHAAQLRYHEEPGGRHNERAWAQRIHLPLLYLFGER